jgi:hypothetical protein
MNYDIGSTHIPVLVSLGRTREIRSVLELGAGMYSTPLFLNRNVFPHLESLVSFEDNPEWVKKVLNVCVDERLILVSDFPNLEKRYDLIFVDNSIHLHVRAATIRKVCDEVHDTLVVIHDAEDVNYIPEIDRFQWHKTIKTYEKWTAVAVNGNAGDIPNIRPAIENNLHLDPTDVDGWLEVLR